MIIDLLYLILRTLIGLVLKAYALPFALRIVAIRNWLCVAFASEEGKAQREEMLANLPDEIANYRFEGDSSDVIATKIILRVVTGLPSDMAIWAPFVPALLVDKIVGWSETLRLYRIPAVMIAGVAILLPMNYSFFIIPNEQALGTKIFANFFDILIIALLWNRAHPLARRIFNSLMGISMIGAVAFMAWMTIQSRFYETITFQLFMLAIISFLPTIIVVDKSQRNRLFKGKWWLIVLCWSPIIAGALVGCWLMAGSVWPLLEVWAAIALFMVMLLIFHGVLALAAFALCWAGIRGSAGGLRLVASGIRRLR